MTPPASSRDTFTLSFRLGRVPITVEPSFWIVSLIMGLSSEIPLAIAWMGLVFVSVLAHEMGHASAAMAFGSGARIRLYSFGGLTYHARLPPLASVLVSLSGPFAGFVLGGSVLLFQEFVPVETARGIWLVQSLLWINFGWGLINLLPVVPLDGGHVLQGLLGEHRRRLALYVSVGTAALIAAVAFLNRSTYVAILFAYLAVNAFQALQRTEDEP